MCMYVLYKGTASPPKLDAQIIVKIISNIAIIIPNT